MGSGSLLGGGVGVSLVDCCLGRFSKGEDDGMVSFVGCFTGRFSKGEGESESESDITCKELVWWDGSSARGCWN
jgi:hypothetical protein